MELTPEQLKKFKDTIWNFYKRNKRNFPWRETTNPYNILVSEMMLQQTQTGRVLPKYNEFIKKFPSLDKLNQAKISEVLKAWSGLGYNRRALYLKQAAVHLANTQNFTPENLTLAKGIGKNTAGAIYVFSYNKPYVFIETNIRRVFIYEFFKNSKTVTDKEILELVQNTLDQRNPREWYYALMDYGAFLSKVKVNPNTKSKHYSKQSKFEGSVRQTRGNILKLLLKTNNMSIQDLKEQIKSNHFDKALKELESEKFLKITNKIVSI